MPGRRDGDPARQPLRSSGALRPCVDVPGRLRIPTPRTLAAPVSEYTRQLGRVTTALVETDVVA
jgi:hypothetical protein